MNRRIALALVPLALLLWDVYHKQVGANPLEFATRTTGMLTLLFLVITVAVTPARQITGLNWLIKFRRMLGLFAFFYCFLHLLTYILFDRYLNLRSVPGDIATRFAIPLIAIGPVASFIGGQVFGYGAFGFSYRPGIVAGLTSAGWQFVLSLVASVS